MDNFTNDYLLNKKVRILQPVDGYRASSDAVLLASLIENIKLSDTILDVGSGTGAVSLCLAYRFPENHITGLEIQPQLADFAKQSADINNFANLVYYQADIRQKKLPVSPCFFSHVITNPPYSEHDRPSPNLSKALAHNHTDFTLNEWLKFCLKMLKPFGKIYLINRVEAIDEILNTFSKRAGGIKIIPVYSKPGQQAKRILISAQKDSKAPTVICPPFYMYNSDGTYTRAADEILRKGKSLIMDIL